MSTDRLNEEELEMEDEFLDEEELEEGKKTEEYDDEEDDKAHSSDDDDDEDEEDDDLDEVDASMGDPSMAPDPVKGQTKPRRGDKRNGDKAPQKVKTKVGVINAMVEKMQSMDRSSLVSSFDSLLAALQKEYTEEDGKEINEEKYTVRSVSAEDINLEEDLNAIFKNESDLTEEFKDKATTIFEAAVVSKVNQILENIAAEQEAELAEAKEEIYNDLAEKLDEYLEYIAAEYVEENKVAIERGIRQEMVENFLGGLKNLFVEHYVEIPEDKVDIVEELVAHTEDLQAQLDETHNKLVEARKQVKDGEKEDIFEELSEDLTDTDAAKFKDLAEAVAFEDSDSYREKLETIKESYFDNSDSEIGSLNEELDYEGPIEEEKTKPTGAMNAYVNAIGRSARKE